MLSAILQIIAVLLRLVERHLRRADEGQEEAMDAKFRKALADGDFGYASYLLNNRVWSAKKKHNSVEK